MPDLPRDRERVVLLLRRVLLPVEQLDTRLLRQVRSRQVLSSDLSKSDIVSHGAGFEDRSLGLFLLDQVRPIVLLPEDTSLEYGLAHGVALGSGVGIDGDLHPRRREDGGLGVVVGIAAPLERLPAVHGLWSQRDPALVLRDHRHHPRLILVSRLYLVPRILHQTQVLRDLTLVHCVLQCVLSEDLVSPLEILLLIFGSLKHFLCY